MSRPVWNYRAVLNTFSTDIGVTGGALTGGSTPASSAYPAANDALFVPIYLVQNTSIKRLFAINGSAVSGNIDVGIYTADGALIFSSGSTAQSGTNQPQFFDIADWILSPGRYYFAVALDNTTGTLFRANYSLARLKALGMAKMASAFPLPATATLATVTDLYLPLIGAEIFRVL